MVVRTTAAVVRTAMMEPLGKTWRALKMGSENIESHLGE
jgi:hypothetical protein